MMKCSPIMVAAGLFFMTSSSISAGSNSVLFSDNFESYTPGTRLMGGTNGRYAFSSPAIIQTNVVSEGAKAAMIPADSIFAFHTEGVAATQIWTQMDIRAVLHHGIEFPSVDTNMTVIFYVKSNGYFVVHNGSPTNWQILTNTALGSAAAPVSEDDWVHIDLYQNYSNKTCALFADYRLLKDDIQFVNSNVSSFKAFDIYNGADTSYLDNISISMTRPEALGRNGGDWLPDLMVSLTNLERTIMAGENAAPQSFEVWKTNGYYYMLIYTNTAGTNWLSISPFQGENAGEHDMIEVIYNTSNLKARATPYKAVIQVAAVESMFGYPAKNSSQTVQISVLVKNQPCLMVSPGKLTHEITKGQKAPCQTFQVWNGSAAARVPLVYTMRTQEGWLRVNPTSGLSTDTTNIVSVIYNTAGLAPGVYTGTIFVEADKATGAAVNSSQQVEVNLIVK